LQRQLLEAEGIAFDARGQVDLARFGWSGPSREWATAHSFTPLPARRQDDQGEQLPLF